MKNQISIIGCGWLGLPLAKALISEGYTIKGSSTRNQKLNELKAAHILPYQIELNETKIEGDISGFLKDSSILIINVPPGLRKNPNKNHVAEIECLIEMVENSSIEFVLFVSSTSVYTNTSEFPVIEETSSYYSHSKSSKQLLEVEKLLNASTKFKTTVIRFGGLFGDDRHPAKYLAGRSNILNGKAPINLIHREDCISILSEIIKQHKWECILHAAIDHHPTKKEYYTTFCKTHNLPLPTFNTSQKSVGKIINSNKMVQLLNYMFKHGL